MSTLEDAKRRMRDKSPEVRRRAVMSLEAAGEPEAKELIIEALGDEDWRVRKEAVSLAATSARGGDLLDRLVASMLQEENVGQRNAAAEALAAAGRPAVDAILEAMSGFDESGRKIACEVLGASDDPRAVDALAVALDDEDSNVRMCAAEWIGEVGGRKAVDALLPCLGSSDKLLVLAALQSLNTIGEIIAWELLEPLTKEPLYGDELLLALGRSGDVRAADVIVRELSRSHVAARALELLHGTGREGAEAVHGVLNAAPEGVLNVLAERASEEEPVERQAAARCLLWSRRSSHMPRIVELARSESMYPLLLEELGLWGDDAIDELENMVSRETGRALASVIGLLSRLIDEGDRSRFGPLFSRHLASDDPLVVTAAAGAAARFGDVRDLDRLVELMGSVDSRISRTASLSLAEMGGRFPEAVAEKMRALDIAGPCGIHICRVLEVVGGTEDVGRLAAAMTSPSPQLRRAVIVTLAAIARENALDKISLALTDEDTGVRMAAASALARVGPAASETIVSALRTAESPVKGALIRALGKVGHPEAPGILRGLLRGPADEAITALEAAGQLELDPGQILEEILGHPDGEVVKQALSVLSESVPNERLARLLEHQAWDVRLAAVEGLETRALDEGLENALRSRLAREDDDLVREAMRRLLGRTR